jgi:glycosyltransferase involved in cell wall biosynthesis
MELIRSSLLFIVGMLFRKKILLFFHGWDYGVEKQLFKYFKYIFYVICNHSSRICVLGTEFRQRLIDIGCKESKIDVETTLVEDVVFMQKPLPRFNKVSKRILFLSRIEKDKGIYICLDTFLKLCENHDDISLCIAGDGSELLNAQRYTLEQSIGNVEFLGWVEPDNRYKIFADSDVYFLPSYGEGMPCSILEAMACGLPVITRNVGGIKDFFNDKMGFVTESTDPVIFAQAIEGILYNRNTSKAMGLYNNEYAKKHFMASVVASRIEKKYEEILSSE